MITKEFVPCIYLYRKNCVKSLQDVTVISEDPVKLAQSYCDAGADELIVFDMSEADAILFFLDAEKLLKKEWQDEMRFRRWMYIFQKYFSLIFQ